MELQQKKNPEHESVQNDDTYQRIYLSLDERRMAAGLEAAAILQGYGFMVSRCHLLAQSSLCAWNAPSPLAEQMLQLFADGVSPIHPSCRISWALQSERSPQPSSRKAALLMVPPGVLGFPNLPLSCCNSVCSVGASPDPRGTADGAFFL